jgi:hypothetical protein
MVAQKANPYPNPIEGALQQAWGRGVTAPNGGRGERKERRIPFLRFLRAPSICPSACVTLIFQCLKASKRGVSNEERG